MDDCNMSLFIYIYIIFILDIIYIYIYYLYYIDIIYIYKIPNHGIKNIITIVFGLVTKSPGVWLFNAPPLPVTLGHQGESPITVRGEHPKVSLRFSKCQIPNHKP